MATNGRHLGRLTRSKRETYTCASLTTAVTSCTTVVSMVSLFTHHEDIDEDDSDGDGILDEDDEDDDNDGIPDDGKLCLIWKMLH